MTVREKPYQLITTKDDNTSLRKEVIKFTAFIWQTMSQDDFGEDKIN
jgi:hypothetical protein